MKISMIIVLITLVIWENFLLKATSLDGTSSFKYQTQHYVFRDGDSATGLVRFSNGFTILPATNHASSATLDTSLSCSGGFDLNGTSTLKLTGDLTLDSATTLTSGGTIYGYNRALKLNGQLTLASGNVIHLGGNLIIDAQGHDIFINEYSQLMLDNGATVTICNATIHNKKNSPGWSALALSTTNCRLTLSDLELVLDSDLYINSGQLFIHNDVAISGTSALVWHSIGPCTIESNSSLYFDVGTTFSYAPPCTNKDLIRMMDPSSVLQLNGCSLLATHTGVRLTQGSVLFDNRVVVNSSATNKLNSLTLIDSENFGETIYSVAWTPDGRYLALGGWNPSNFGGAASTHELQIYRLDGEALVAVTSMDYGNSIYELSWSPDGRYLSLVGNGATSFGGSGSSAEFQVYSFNGSTLVPAASKVIGGLSFSPAWSPDGKFIAFAGMTLANGHEVQVYTFDGVALNFLTSQDYGTRTYSVAWSPDGKYLAVGGEGPSVFGGNANSNELQIYRFNGSSLSAVTSQDYGTMIHVVAWSPSGKYLALGGQAPSKFGGVANSNELQVYSFDGVSLTAIASQNYGDYVFDVAWSFDGQYLALGGQGVAAFGGEASSNEIQVYSFDGTTLSPVASQDFGSGVCGLSWSPDGTCLAISGRYPSVNDDEFWVLRCNFVNETATQAITNGITFGNSSAGANTDVNATLLSGARVEINGIVNWDAAT